MAHDSKLPNEGKLAPKPKNLAQLMDQGSASSKDKSMSLGAAMGQQPAPTSPDKNCVTLSKLMGQ